MSRGLLGIGLAVLLTGCGDGPLSPGQRYQVESAQARWVRTGSSDYTVESRIGCFCPPHLNYWTRLTVQSGQITAAEPVEPLEFGAEPSVVGWRTVEGVFAYLQALDGEIIREVTLRFDSERGYPLEVLTTCHDNITDCGTLIEMRNLRIP